MANGFGTGLAQGAQAGSAIVQNRLKRELGFAALDEQRLARESTERMKALDEINKNFTTLRDQVLKAATPEIANRVVDRLTKPLDSTGRSVIQSLAGRIQELGGGATPEQLVQQLRAAAATVASPEEKGAAAKEQATAAGGITASEFRRRSIAVSEETARRQRGRQDEIAKLTTEIKRLPPGSLERRVRIGKLSKLTGVEIKETPDGRLTVTEKQPKLPAAQKIELEGSRATLTQGRRIIQAAIEATKTNPERFGVKGSVGRFSSQISGAVSGIPGVGDFVQGVIDMFDGERKRKTAGAASELFKGPLSSDTLLENSLVFIRARTLQPTGKLLSSTIERAKSDVNLTGITGAENIRAKLELFLQELDQSLKAVEGQLGGAAASAGAGQTDGKPPRFRLNPDGSVERIQ